jgi:fructan beta-fructosidase
MRGSEFKDMPFSQQVSFPCELTLHETSAGLRLFRQPVREIELLHQSERKFESRSLKSGEEIPLASSGELFRIKAEVSIPQGAKVTFNLRGYQVILTATTVESGTGPHTALEPVRSVEILLDRASVETFVNQGEISSTRNFTPHQEGLSIKSDGGDVAIRALSVYPLKSMWAGQAVK